MKILSFHYDNVAGFVWILVENKNSNLRPLTIQCCLEQDGTISLSDHQATQGACACVNAPAFECWGENRCINALIDIATVNGIEVLQ